MTFVQKQNDPYSVTLVAHVAHVEYLVAKLIGYNKTSLKGNMKRYLVYLQNATYKDKDCLESQYKQLTEKRRNITPTTRTSYCFRSFSPKNIKYWYACSIHSKVKYNYDPSEYIRAKVNKHQYNIPADYKYNFEAKYDSTMKVKSKKAIKYNYERRKDFKKILRIEEDKINERLRLNHLQTLFTASAIIASIKGQAFLTTVLENEK
jgi:hypothetical protein